MACKAREMTAEAIVSDNAAALLDEMKLMGEAQGQQGTRKVINSELWHACAGPLVSLPQPGSLVYYFPQGHSEQVTISTRKTANTHIANYPNLSSQLMCQVHNVTLHADKDTDEIFAQMSLQPVNSELDVFPIPDFGHTKSKQPTEFFCKNLTASDTSTHGGFSVPRRAAEKLFPQLDYTMQPPNQELVVRDLHDNLWTFRHIYRGQPKRHLLTTGWSLFVGAKRLKAGDSVLFIRDEKSQLLLGVRRANRQQTTSPSSVLSADSMHMGVLAAAAHAAASLSPFTVYYNPRSCPSEFIIPLAKYHKSAYTQVSIGMRFGMMFETDESTKRRYMGTIVGISDCDPLRWPHSKWRSLQVEWDEHGYGERPDRVSLWEIETPESLFIFPSHSSRLKRQCLPGFVVPGTGIGFGNMNHLSQTLENGNGIMHPVFSGLGSEQLMNVLLKPQAQIPESRLGFNQSIYANILQNLRGSDASRACPSALPSFSATRIPVHELLMQQQTLQQQNVTLQIPKPRNFIEQQGVVDSEKNQFSSLQEPNRQEQNVCSDRRNSSESRCASPLLSRNSSETVHDKSEVASLPLRNQVDEGFQENAPYMQHTVESLMEPSNYENLKASLSVNNRPQVKDPDEPSKALQSQWIETAHSLDKNISNNVLACQGYRSQFSEHDWVLNSSCYQSFKTDSLILFAPESTTGSSADISSIVNPETYNLVEKLQFSSFSDSQSPQCLPNFIQEFFGGQELNTGIVPFDVHELLSQEEEIALKDRSNSSKVKDLSDDSINQSVTYNNLPLENSNGSVLTSSCVSSTVLEAIDTTRGSHFLFPSEELVGNFSLNQEIQSQVSSANLTESQVFSLQEIPDSSGGTSSVDFNTHGLSNRDQKKHLSQPPLRTYTKVQKLGSVGRSIDVTRFRNYHELTSAIACMFGLQGQLDDHRGSDWKLVYVDYENDVLLVGDDPWEEFVNCVRCIRILSPSEVQQMIHEGMQLMNNYIPPPSE